MSKKTTVSHITQVARDPAPPGSQRRVFQAFGLKQSKVRVKNAGSREHTVRWLRYQPEFVEKDEKYR